MAEAPELHGSPHLTPPDPTPQVTSLASIVYAPLITTKLTNFFAVVAEVQSAVLAQQLRVHMRRLMWAGAKGKDLLSEVLKSLRVTPPRTPSDPRVAPPTPCRGGVGGGSP